ncbi:hypothetical protein DIY06_01435 [Streptococcus iniae]|uniref:YdeI/OmpD-associated family protein n=1 Tax=Streptococcus iniae TaxID=1346 RepID=UPI000EF7192F|nr:YdeI/OmpD-associated family protein [Streptococcus iniae]RLU53090.1 hypothetical protein DIY06_01435 [Streptococcus iniae]RLU76479.1 hypothetical protein DIY05_01460 [Streptococcus iniae]RLV04048.1 hypothetical protein DIX84_01435 [Streptococcus iniae]RLV20834.1 hypothetical protein DIX72_01420 [Streptococcus iniae]RLV25996.1 hypothetical protein DIX73_01430 [Streptococcus iniae]
MTKPLFKKLKMAKFQDITLMKLAREKSVFDHFPQNAFPADLIVGYVYHLEEMKELIFRVFNEKLLKPNGHLYLMYPKTKNKLGYEAIGRDSIFPFLKVDQDNGYVEGTTIKFNRMNALDDNYTLLGLKYTKEVEERSASKSSQKVADYVEKINDVKAYLTTHPKEKVFFEQLTPGYQRGWARYIYSAKTKATQEKRQTEMLDILKAGFKSRELYRASLKS